MEKINSEHLKAENSVNINFRGMSTGQIKMNLAKNEYVEITGEKQGIMERKKLKMPGKDGPGMD